MTDKTIHSFPLISLKSGLEIPVVDYSRDPGDRNVRMVSDDIFTHIAANKNTAGYNNLLAQAMPSQKGTSLTVPVYQLADGDTNDMFLVSLEISVYITSGHGYTYSIYAGDPNNGGRQVYNYATIVVDNIHTVAASVYIPYAWGNAVYLQINNAVGGGFTFSTQALVLEVTSNAPGLPQAPPPPPPYTGPQLTTINVGPTREQFRELSDVFPPGFISTLTTQPAAANATVVTVNDATNLIPGTPVNALGSVYIAPGTLVVSASGNDVTLSKGLLIDAPTGTPIGAIYRPAVVPGGTVILDGNATYYRPVHIGQGYDGTTIKGPRFSGPPAICDGRGGVGTGAAFRLSFGNGFINSYSVLNVDGIWFQGAGGADHVGDGEAALHFVSPATTGTINITHCRFDGNENGIFIPSYTTNYPGTTVTCNISYCDFGYVIANGQSKDGQSHDFYIQCDVLNVDHCNFYGTTPKTGGSGNCIKSRSATTNVTNCWIRNSDDRCIDCPDGGYLNVTNCILTNMDDAVANLIGYGNESDKNGYQPTFFTNCTLLISRYESVIWNCCLDDNGVATTMTFVNPTVQLYRLAGGAEAGSLDNTGSMGPIVGLTLPLSSPRDVPLPSVMPPAPAPLA